jgi:signal transduction histidine kinase
VVVPARGAQGPSQIAAIIDWRAVGRDIARDTAITAAGFAWLLDSDGTLLFNPAHAEVPPPSPKRAAAGCMSCHSSWELALGMLGGGAGTGEIEVRGAARKLVAYAPLNVAGRRWSLAVAAPYSDVVASGKRRTLTVFVVKGFLAALVLVLAFLLDLNSRRQIRALRESKAAIRALNENLEAEVVRRTAEATAAFAEVSAARARYASLERLAIVGELASIIAHEVRAPLNALALGAQRLVRLLPADGGLEVAKARDIAASQTYEIRRIDTFIQDYLRLARLPRRQMRATDLGGLIESSVRLVDADGHGVRFRVEVDPTIGHVDLDGDQIRRVILNLLVNAIQALPGGGEVQVTAQRAGDEVVVSVSDNGPGIAATHEASLFKPFFTTKQDGTGLGLSICARIIEEHHGAIECDRGEGRGATFRFRLPISQPAARAAARGG